MPNRIDHTIAHALSDAVNNSPQAYAEALDYALKAAEHAKTIEEQDAIIAAINASTAVMAGIGDDRVKKAAEKILMERVDNA